jgi:signal peptidase I
MGQSATATDANGGYLPPFAVDKVHGSFSVVRETVVLLVLAAAVAIGMKAMVAQAFYIPSESMVPQLRVRDRIVVSKLAYRLHDPRRGDIVVFDCPPLANNCKQSVHRLLPLRLLHDVGEAIGMLQPDRDEYIKRVIGLPGETVEGHDGHVFVDGRQLVEPYLPAGIETEDFRPTKVPAGRLWVMGDNRGDSQDSRYFGPIRRGKIVGRTVFKIWPLTRTEFL